MSIAEQVEEEFAACAVEGHEAQFVQDEQVDAVEAALKSSEFSGVSGLDQRADEVRGPHEGDMESLPGSFEAERDRQVRLSQSRRGRPG